jgi:hypothetical protein
MIADEVPETIVKKVAWGSVRSNMLATYAHLSDADVDRVLLAKAGIKTPEKKAEVGVRARQCTNCGKINASTDKFCSICGTPLTSAARSKLEGHQKWMDDNPEAMVAYYQAKADEKKKSS